MIFYSEKLLSKVFPGDTMKDAFLKASKWYASNIISQGMENVSVKYIKDPDGIGANVIQLEVYADLPSKNVIEEHCKICKDVSKNFFMTQEVKCESCRINAYFRREKDIMRRQLAYLREKLKNEGVM